VKKVLITGAAGFIGHHFVEDFLRTTDWDLIIIDRLDVTSTLHRLTDIESWEQHKSRVKFLWHDLKSEFNHFLVHEIGKVDYILHLAASSHVDRSIEDPMSFAMDNVIGTVNLLNFVRKEQKDLERFLYFSTDEVFGPAPVGTYYKEWDRYHSGNPYAASKAGGEEFCMAFHNTYKVPVIVAHCMNVIGERQDPEKFIPMCIRKILLDEKIVIHADPTKTRPGTRFYIHARNVSSAIKFLLDKGKIGDKYNIPGEKEVNNLEVAKSIGRIMGKEPKTELVDFHSSRPGHDLRYALDGTKIHAEGWKQPYTFERSLEKTVNWYMNNQKWLELPPNYGNLNK
jgi:dTDP-glucose 4,6-dehydratase